MQTRGELNQESYWIYETHRTYLHAPLFKVEPRTLMVFPSREDAKAFGGVFILLPLLTLRRVLMEELEFIIESEFKGNYIVLESSDAYIVGARYQFAAHADYGDIPEG